MTRTSSSHTLKSDPDRTSAIAILGLALLFAAASTTWIGWHAAKGALAHSEMTSGQPWYVADAPEYQGL